MGRTFLSKKDSLEKLFSLENNFFTISLFFLKGANQKYIIFIIKFLSSKNNRYCNFYAKPELEYPVL